MKMTRINESKIDQIQTRFITRQEKYSVPDFPFSISTGLTPVELNKLVNSLIKDRNDVTQNVEFTFVIDGEIILTNIHDLIEEKQICTESVINIEYLEKYSAPEPYTNLNHEDWVSGVQTSNDWILSGSYDHSVQIWKKHGEHLTTIPGHSGCVKSVSWIQTQSSMPTFVSGSMDQTLIIWEWNIATNEAYSLWTCKGHTLGIESVDVSQSGSHIASGSWDKTLKIWSLVDDGNYGDLREVSSKKLKSSRAKSKVPILTLSGHNEAVTSVVWSGEQEVMTGSWDHTIKVWDVDIGGVKSQLVGNKSFFGIDWSENSRCLVSCSADRHIRLYDPRSQEGSVVKCTLSCQRGWVTCVKWSPKDQYLFISGGHDKVTKLWDTRSPKVPLYQMIGHEDKILCCDWSDPSLIVSGGCDNSVKIFSYKQK